VGQLPNKIKAMTVIAGGTIPTLIKLGQFSITQAEIPTPQACLFPWHSRESLVKIWKISIFPLRPS
jgi:hypothetical protein